MKRMKTVAHNLLLTAAGLYVLLLVAAVLLQTRLMYHPDRERVPPVALGLSGVEEVAIPTADGVKVLAWRVKAKPGQPTILYFHGNAGALATRAERLRKYAVLGRGMLLVTYRGFGGSQGSPSERANVADALASFDMLVAEGVAPADIIVYGESLGTGVAVQVAAARSAGGLILDAPYTSTVEMARRTYWFLPVDLLMRDRYETWRHIAGVRAPLLIVHGENDEVIPVAMGRQVAAAAVTDRVLAVIAGAHHNDHHLFGSYTIINDWIDGQRLTLSARSSR